MRSLILTAAAAAAVASFVSTARAELLYATDGSNIARFDSATPGSITSVGVTGLQSGETLVGIDVRPSTYTTLYGVGSSNRVYTVNPITGAATQVGSAGLFTLNGANFGTDFNPVPDRIRQISDTEQNLRLNPNDGTQSANDPALNPVGNFVAAAYTNNFPGTPAAQLYLIDSVAGSLGLSSNPNAGGPINLVGTTLGLGTSLNPNIGFDISGVTTTAYASITNSSGVSGLYTINLQSGIATLVGAIGSGATPYLGLTAAVAPEPGVAIGSLGLMGLLFRRRR